MRNAKVHYEVFCLDEAPFRVEDADLSRVLGETVHWSRIARADAPGRFTAPHYGPPSKEQHRRFRSPVPRPPDAVMDGVQKATVCYLITADLQSATSLDYLDACIMLAGEIAATRHGVVIDRTSDIGYTARQFIEQEEALEVRDTVVILENENKDRVLLRTAGMSKFGQKDFVLERFPVQYAELGRRLLYDNLCTYAAFRAPILAGQNMEYLSTDPAAKWFFSDAANGCLAVTDCHQYEKRPLPGLKKYLSVAVPLFEQQLAKELAQPRGRKAVPNKVKSLDEYVQLVKVLESRGLEPAMSEFELDYDELSQITDLWSEKLEDRKIASEFISKLKKR